MFVSRLNLPLFAYQLRRWVLFCLIPSILVFGAAYVRGKNVTPVYQTSATLYVQAASQSGSVPGSTDVYTSEQLLPTYSRMITLPVISDAIDRAVDRVYPGYDIAAHNLTVGNSNVALAGSMPNTQLLDISVQDTVPARAKLATDAAANALIKKIVSIQHADFKGAGQALQRQLAQSEASIQSVSQRIAAYHGPDSGLNSLKAQLSGYQSIYQTVLSSQEEFNVGRDTALNGIRVFSPAPVPTTPLPHSPLRGAILYLFLALLVTGGAVYTYGYLDDTLQTPEEVETVAGARILGTILRVDRGTSLFPTEQGESSSRGTLADAYRLVRTNLLALATEVPVRTVMVTSAAPEEGKSTTISNLARVLAESGKKVLLVDADLRRPSLHRIFRAEHNVGLVEALHDSEQEVRLEATDHANLSLLVSGSARSAPTDSLGSPRMKQLLPALQAKSEIVLLDSPPVLAVPDAAVMSMMVDGVVLVVDPSRTTRRDLRRTKDAIEGVGGTVLGVVVNRLSRASSPYYYYYYQYHYGYSYSGVYHSEKSDASRRERSRTLVRRIRRRRGAA